MSTDHAVGSLDSEKPHGKISETRFAELQFAELTMNELTKTLIFLLLAVALVTGAFLSRPTARDFKPEEMLGTILFPLFTDPLAIKSLEIVRLNVAGERNDFHIAEVNGVWSIPSHDNYPADARDQMGRVAEALTDLKVLQVIQPEGSGIDSIAFQTLYGVIDPTDENASLGDGVGIKIILGGADDTTLVNLIVGKSVTPQQSQDMMDEDGGLRYVRVVNQAPVYVVNIEPGHFSTDFGQWIERNLLDISTFDIKEFFVDQYSFSVEYVLTNRGLQPIPRDSFIGDITLGYNASAIGADKWSLLRWMTFAGQEDEYMERELEPGRELNTDTLDAMVSALNDLRIVSVLKKPAGLAAALRTEAAFDNIGFDAAMQESMQETGFWLVQLPDLKGGTSDTKIQLLSNEGDMQLRLNNGVVYHLRFGDLAGTETEVPLQPHESPFAIDSSARMVPNRYLFITAEFDASIIPLPELREVPEIPSEGAMEELEQLMREKEAAELANQREQERYEAEMERGKHRAAELSDRFADWYYVISDDVYKNIHLTDANVFRFRMPDFDEIEPIIWEGVTPGLPEIMPEGELPVLVEHLRDLPAINFEFEQGTAEEPQLESTEGESAESEAPAELEAGEALTEPVEEIYTGNG